MTSSINKFAKLDLTQVFKRSARDGGSSPTGPLSASQRATIEKVSEKKPDTVVEHLYSTSFDTSYNEAKQLAQQISEQLVEAYGPAQAEARNSEDANERISKVAADLNSGLDSVRVIKLLSS